jgi:hypothetical protein
MKDLLIAIILGLFTIGWIAYGIYALFARRKGHVFRAAKGKGCPKCGCRRFQHVPGQDDTIVVAYTRICADCGHEYMIGPPWWVGLIAYLFALVIVAAMVIDMVAPPRDWPMHFTWHGRFAVLAFAGGLIWIGTYVIRSRTQKP